MVKGNTFRIGISMAGAVSAGAYTAGVMDYLLEALEDWERAKELNLPGVPKHNVLIEVLSGASAGGMTAVITAAAIQKNFPHINLKNYNTPLSRDNPLFDSWVNLTEEPSKDMMSQMLSLEDILDNNSNPKNEVSSVFNSLFIEKIAKRTLDNIIKDKSNSRPYFARDMELLTTITNLRGFEYNLQFITAVGTREDRMSMHKDLVHLQLNPAGIYNNDGKIPYHFETIEGLNKNLLVDAAITTGAFPIGLSPRVVVRNPKYINDNPLLKITHGKGDLVNSQADYSAVCVDGGVINNEPYDLTGTILINRRKEEIEQESGKDAAEKYQMKVNPATFDTTILMIDPFPNYDDQPSYEYFNLIALKFSLPKLLGAIRKQVMIKTDLLEQAYDDDDYTRFLIAPIRTVEGELQHFSLACGSLEGFGGFFSKEFRIHDYMLGRRNCQRFIQLYFCVPVSAANPIIKYGYENLDENSIQLLRVANTQALPIIPDIRISNDNLSIRKPDPEEKYQYPSISLKYLMGLEKKVQKRFEIVVNNINKGENPGGAAQKANDIIERIRKKSWLGKHLFGPVLGFISDRFINIGKSVVEKLAAEKFIDTVITDMYNRGQLNQDC